MKKYWLNYFRTTLLISFLFFIIFCKIEADDNTVSPFFIIQNDEMSVERFPLLSTSADVNIRGVIADVKVIQLYTNTGTAPIEAIYVFPASTRAAVYGMTMRINERVIKAEIKEKDEARKIYEDAKKEGKSTSLLEQFRPNVFRMNVANILPGDTIFVELKYTELLEAIDGKYEFVYPTVVGPRYSSSDQSVDFETIISEADNEPSYDFNMNLILKTGMPIQEIESTSHSITKEKISESEYDIQLAEGSEKEGNRDFILKYSLRGSMIQTGLLLEENTDENFFLLMLQPPMRVENDNIPEREFIFLIDVSGSMLGFPIEVSKELIKGILNNLRFGDRFNFITFAGGYDVYSDESVPATWDNIEKAINYLNELQGSGGTELNTALEYALQIPSFPGFSRTILIMTDGYISTDNSTYKIVRDNLNKANVFSFGIGSSCNRNLIELIARAGYGEAFIAESKDEAEELATKVKKYILSPVLTDIEVEFNEFDAFSFEPKSLPDVFAERPIILYGKWKGTKRGNITITGKTGNEKLQVKIPVDVFGTKDTSNALKYLWARKRLENLNDLSNYSNNSAAKTDITEIGLKYNLLTKYTSFVAVDNMKRNIEGGAIEVDQPLPVPENVTYGVGNGYNIRGSSGNYGSGMANALEPAKISMPSIIGPSFEKKWNFDINGLQTEKYFDTEEIQMNGDGYSVGLNYLYVIGDVIRLVQFIEIGLDYSKYYLSSYSDYTSKLIDNNDAAIDVPVKYNAELSYINLKLNYKVYPFYRSRFNIFAGLKMGYSIGARMKYELSYNDGREFDPEKNPIMNYDWKWQDIKDFNSIYLGTNIGLGHDLYFGSGLHLYPYISYCMNFPEIMSLSSSKDVGLKELSLGIALYMYFY